MQETKKIKENTDASSQKKASELVEKIKQNDTASFLELLGLYSHTISSLAYSFSLPVSEHEDLCQEGRMALYRAAMSYDEKSAKFSTYAVTCMTNAMISFAKKYASLNMGKVYSVDEKDFEVQQGTSVISSLELEEMLSKDGFGGLSAYERKVMSMKLTGYKVGEIAKLLGRESKSIENTLFRARQKLRKHIDG